MHITKFYQKKLTVVWLNPMLLVLGVLENMFPPNALDWPKAGALCPKAGAACPKAEVVCPKGELVCPREGVLDWNKGDGWVLPKFKPLANDELAPWAWVVPNIDDDPKVDVLGVPKREAEVVDPKPGVEPNTDGVGDGADPKGLEVAVPKGEEPREGAEFPNPGVLKVDVLGANGLVDVVEENGFAGWLNAGDEEKGFACVLLVLKPIPPEDWPAGFGPPETDKKYNAN